MRGGAARRRRAARTRNASPLSRVATRREEVAGIRAKFPTKIPVNGCFVLGGYCRCLKRSVGILSKAAEGGGKDVPDPGWLRFC